MKQIERQDIKTMIDMLDGIYVYEADEENIYSVIKSAISMLENLGNDYNALQLENCKLKQDILQLEAMIED